MAPALGRFAGAGPETIVSSKFGAIVPCSLAVKISDRSNLRRVRPVPASNESAYKTPFLKAILRHSCTLSSVATHQLAAMSLVSEGETLSIWYKWCARLSDSG